jgi:DNA-binding CsgD family transcriptional regulator
MQADAEPSTLHACIQEWLDSLAALEVKALVVLGPASPDDVQARALWVAHPPSFRRAGEAFAASGTYGAAWRASHSPNMAWQNVVDDGCTWKSALAACRIRGLVRSDVAMPFGAGYECVALVGRPLGRGDAFEIGWALANAWPMLRDEVIASRFGLTRRTREVLRVLAEGHTAEVAAERLGMKARTVGYHLGAAMDKLHARNRASAILRACMLGIL